MGWRQAAGLLFSVFPGWLLDPVMAAIGFFTLFPQLDWLDLGLADDFTQLVRAQSYSYHFERYNLVAAPVFVFALGGSAVTAVSGAIDGDFGVVAGAVGHLPMAFLVLLAHCAAC